MSTLTTNLGLTKADDLEQYDVDVVNANLDLIDAAVGDLEDEHVLQTGVAGTVVAANWTLTSISLKKIGKLIQVTFTVTRTTSVLSTNASGDTADTAMFTLPAGYRPGESVGITPMEGTANAIWLGHIASNGQAVFAKGGVTTASIAIGETVRGSALYIQEN